MYCFTPKKVFNKSILNFFGNVGGGVKFNFNEKYKKYLIVTLRAPKHFKVGRNHYNIYKKKFSATYTPSTAGVCATKLRCVPSLIYNACQIEKANLPSVPYSQVSSIKYTAEVSGVWFIV